MRKDCAVNLVQQKIRLLNTRAKDVEKISKLLKKDFVYINLGKKESTSLQDNFNGYIKAISYLCFFLSISSVPSSAY